MAICNAKSADTHALARDYRTAANSPSGTIADTDSFTYDDASRMLTAVSGRYGNTVTYTYVLPTELRSHFLPNCRCRDFGALEGALPNC